MSLEFSATESRQIRELQEILATPLGHSSTEAWLEAVHEQSTDHFGVARSLVVLPVGSSNPLIDSPNMEPSVLRGLRSAIVETGPEVNRYDDPELNRAMQRLAAAGLEVWTKEIAERVSGVELERMPRFYPEVVQPGRLEGMLVMGHSLPEGQAMFQVFPERPSDRVLGDQAVEMFRLLLPAFKAGCRALVGSIRRQRGLQSCLDNLTEGVVLYRGGEPIFRNRAMRRLLDTEERADRLVAEADRCAEALRLRLGATRAWSSGGTARLIRTATNRYRVAASHLEGGNDGRPATIMVVVRPAVPPLPDRRTLQRRYGMTPRQAEVALLVARGRSNREVAEHLGISSHTARHHAQRALEKTGAESRKALALRLLADREI